MPGCLTGIFRKRKKRRWLLYGKRNLPWQTNPLSRNYPDYISGSKHPIGCFTSQLALYIKRIAAILLLPLLGAFGTYYYLTKGKPVVEEAQLKECFVANGEQKQVKLPDGTKVWLNSGSLLVYDKHFRGKKTSPVPQRGSPLPSRQRSGKTLFGQNRPYDGQSTRHRIQSKRLFRPGCYDCHVGRRENPSLSLFEARHKPDFIARRTNHLQSPPGNTGTQYCRRRTRDAMDRRVSDIPDGLFDQIVKTIERKFDVTINYETERFAGRSFTMKFNPDEGLKQVLEVMKEMIKGLNYKIKEDKVYIN